MLRVAATAAFAVSAVACGSLCGASGAPEAASPAKAYRLVATGRGRPPARSISEAQKRLMAKRAAMVEAYSNMVRELGRMRSTVTDGIGCETVQGFIKGIELIETRYYEGGEVEVSIGLGIPAGGESRRIETPAARGVPEGTLVRVEGGGPVAVSEWRIAFGSASPPVP